MPESAAVSHDVAPVAISGWIQHHNRMICTNRRHAVRIACTSIIFHHAVPPSPNHSDWPRRYLRIRIFLTETNVTQVPTTGFIHTVSPPLPATATARFGGVWLLVLTLLAGAVSLMLASVVFAGDASALEPTAFQTSNNDTSASANATDQQATVTPGMAAASA